MAMTEVTVTDWFPGWVKPVRPGWYEVSYWMSSKSKHSVPVRRWFDGRDWFFGPKTNAWPLHFMKDDLWRGLVKAEAFSAVELANAL